MIKYKHNDLSHNLQVMLLDRKGFIEDLAKRKQYQIAKEMGLTSTQMSFLVSVFWAIPSGDIGGLYSTPINGNKCDDNIPNEKA